MKLQPLVYALAIVVGVSGAGCAKHAAKERKGPPPLAVDVARASQRDIATYLSLDGQVAPLQEATLSMQQPGQLVGIYVTEGQRVGAGQILAKVDDATLRAQLAQNEALVAQSAARARASSLTNPITAQQMNAGVIAAQQQLAQARNGLISAQAAYENARIVYTSNKQLYAQGYLAQTQLEQSRAAYVAAEQQRNSAQDSVTLAQSAVRTAQRNTQQTGVQAEDVAATRGALGAAQAQVQLLRTQLAQTALYAPFSGVITQRLVDPGAMAGPSVPVLRISQLDTVYVNANVPDEDLAFVHTGTPVTFTTSSLGARRFHGTIADVNATPTQGTLSYRARIRQANPDTSLRGGMLVTLNIRKEFHKAAIVVPRSAIFQTESGARIFTVADGKAREIPVTLGLQTDALSEVRSPSVHPGTVVITTRPDALQNGSVVAIGGPPPARGVR